MPVITRKKLEDYKKNKRSIPMLEAELAEMLHTDAGLGSSVILDYKKGYPAPQSVVGFNGPAYDRRQKELERIKKDCQEVEEWIADHRGGAGPLRVEDVLYRRHGVGER